MCVRTSGISVSAGEVGYNHAKQNHFLDGVPHGSAIRKGVSVIHGRDDRAHYPSECRAVAWNFWKYRTQLAPRRFHSLGLHPITCRNWRLKK